MEFYLDLKSMNLLMDCLFFSLQIKEKSMDVCSLRCGQLWKVIIVENFVFIINHNIFYQLCFINYILYIILYLQIIKLNVN